MLGGTKAISPCVMREEHVGKAVLLALHTVSAPSGEERTR
jgi:hypothetical protein